MTSLWNTYRNRFEYLREAYDELTDYEREYYGGEGGDCCSEGTQDSHIILLALYVLIIALAAFLVVATNTGSLGRRKRAIGESGSQSNRTIDEPNKGKSNILI